MFCFFYLLILVESTQQMYSVTVTEVVHILSSDDEEEKAVTSVATATTQSTSVACTVATTVTYQVHHSLHQWRSFMCIQLSCHHDTAPSYLAETLQLTSSVESRRPVRSSSTCALLVPSTQRTMLGDRAFPVAAARAYNALPDLSLIHI